MAPACAKQAQSAAPRQVPDGVEVAMVAIPTLTLGKVWLLPYQTGKSSAPAYPTAYTWYDELIVSTSRIDDPA